MRQMDDEVRATDETATTAPCELGWLGVVTEALADAPPELAMARCPDCYRTVLSCRMHVHRMHGCSPAAGSAAGAGAKQAAGGRASAGAGAGGGGAPPRAPRAPSTCSSKRALPPQLPEPPEHRALRQAVAEVRPPGVAAAAAAAAAWRVRSGRRYRSWRGQPAGCGGRRWQHSLAQPQLRNSNNNNSNTNIGARARRPQQARQAVRAHRSDRVSSSNSSRIPSRTSSSRTRRRRGSIHRRGPRNRGIRRLGRRAQPQATRDSSRRGA
eukprot:XP_001694111.1 predicted protein [Chlamydomonas reinhardtii]